MLRLIARTLVGHIKNCGPKETNHIRRFSADVPDIDQSILKGMITSHASNVQDHPIHYVKTGHGNRLVFLLPGMLGTGATDFEPQLKGMNKDIFTVVAWDPPGYGRSRPPDRTWPKDWFTRDAKFAASFLQNDFAGKKASLMGWSDGAITACILAAEYPDMVDRLIIWGGAAYVGEEDVKINEGLQDLNKWSARMKEPYVNIYGEEYFAEQAGQWCRAYNAYYDHSDGSLCKDHLPKIQCPTLILHGKKDALVAQTHADYLHEFIDGAKLVNIPEAKHNLHLRYPDLVNNICEQFIINPENVHSKL